MVGVDAFTHYDGVHAATLSCTAPGGWMEPQGLSFGEFQLLPERRLLLRGGCPVRIGSRAFDLLITLAGRSGEVVAKEELIARTWPGTFVDEANLRVHIGTLRKSLGDDPAGGRYITNVPGRGYCFVAPVRGMADQRPPPPPTMPVATSPISGNLPVSVTRLVGRQEVVDNLVTLLSQQRLVTIVGPGGMGKTTVAVAVARRAAKPGGILFVDLAPVAEPAAVAGALATLLGLTDRSVDLAGNLVEQLRDRALLLVLDNCEHVIEGAAALAEILLSRLPSLTILATSREPLRAAGEWVQRLRPLDVPPEGNVLAADAMGYAAVQLFVERASACLGGYALKDTDAPAVAEICRRLDGIALAIELAAGHLDTTSIAGLAASLDDCFRVLTRGRRTALPRHQTLRATLDWSYRTLPAVGQRLLRHLSVFNGVFTAALVAAILPPDEEMEIDEALAELAAKSLLTVERGQAEARYRLLDTTRAYARIKLEGAGEADAMRRRHATHYRAVFEQAEAEWETKPTPVWLSTYIGHVDNLRAALDWAFSSDGDPSIGIGITVAAVPFWFALLQVEECHARVHRALELLEIPAYQNERQRMKLYAALGWQQMRASTVQPHGAAAWQRTLDIATRLNDADYQSRALWALWVDRTNDGQPRAALAMAERFAMLAAQQQDEADIAIADRMRARSLLFQGRFAEARASIDRMLERYTPPVNRAHTVRFQYEQRSVARITLARLLWMQGHPVEAMQEVEATIAEVAEMGHELTLAHVLSDAACAIALLNDDLEKASQFISLLQHVTKVHSLDVWNTYADGFAGELLIRQDEVADGLSLVESALERLRQTRFVLYETALVLAQARGLNLIGRSVEALAVVDAALDRCACSGEAWYLAELHRERGELLAALSDYGGAEAALNNALNIAQEQHAIGWQVRAIASLTRFSGCQRRSQCAQ
ncbi:transcriptional regulator [Niveispirillum cyanobacteriorum]|uniref:Transcriptional regulator n=2 Tax=Niveispirillum cyanobacteriorum TaxID=1612173 RepID=A0A2K9NK81_9PROT|nr:transcriptional regulator [Niveispirillum cyanobacteriorum]